MKSINQIFKNNKHLLDYDEVQNLIKYCESLEDEIVDLKQSKDSSKEISLSELVKEIYYSINSLNEDEENYEKYHNRYPEFKKPDYKDALKNLKIYLNQWAKDNKFYF